MICGLFASFAGKTLLRHKGNIMMSVRNTYVSAIQLQAWDLYFYDQPFHLDLHTSLQALASNSALQHGPHATELSSGPPTTSASAMRLCKVLHAWTAPISPHLAVHREGTPGHGFFLIHFHVPVRLSLIILLPKI